MFRKWYGVILAGVIGFTVASVHAGPLPAMQRLGKRLYQDKSLSYNNTQSCMTCHHHMSGYADPDNSRDPAASVVSVGADGISTGGRNAPSSAYAGNSPPLHWDANIGGYRGGMFWDGRATGLVLGDPLAEQAQGPPLNPVEMNMPDVEAVVQAVRDADYAPLFRQVFGQNALDDAALAFVYISQSIAAYERSAEVQKFSSRFDRGQLTTKEQQGFTLFQTNCATCHSAGPLQDGEPPLFTAHTYENIGLPSNPLLSGNPVDLGLGGFLEADFHSATPLVNDANYSAQYGKFKTPTLRNIAMTAPYGHNGVFSTVRSMVAFHNTRDIGNWPPPEVADNLNTTTVGNMGLSDGDVDAIVAFLMTLNDRSGMGP